MKFKKLCFEKFGTCQASGMETSKRDALDHVFDDFHDVVNVHASHRGQYEGPHRFFEEDYRRRSKKAESAMKDTVNLCYSMLSDPAAQNRKKNPRKIMSFSVLFEQMADF